VPDVSVPGTRDQAIAVRIKIQARETNTCIPRVVLGMGEGIDRERILEVRGSQFRSRDKRLWPTCRGRLRCRPSGFVERERGCQRRLVESDGYHARLVTSRDDEGKTVVFDLPRCTVAFQYCHLQIGRVPLHGPLNHGVVLYLPTLFGSRDYQSQHRLTRTDFHPA